MGSTSTSTLSCNKPDGTGEVWLQTPGNGTAELPEQLPPSRVRIPSTQGGSPEPGVKPGADPGGSSSGARRRCRAEPRNAAGWTRQSSVGTRETGRKSDVRSYRFTEISEIKSKPSPAPLPPAKSNNLRVTLRSRVGTRRFPRCCSDPAAPNSPGASRSSLPKSEPGCKGG